MEEVLKARGQNIAGVMYAFPGNPHGSVTYPRDEGLPGLDFRMNVESPGQTEALLKRMERVLSASLRKTRSVTYASAARRAGFGTVSMEQIDWQDVA